MTDGPALQLKAQEQIPPDFLHDWVRSSMLTNPALRRPSARSPLLSLTPHVWAQKLEFLLYHLYEFVKAAAIPALPNTVSMFTPASRPVSLASTITVGKGERCF